MSQESKQELQKHGGYGLLTSPRSTETSYFVALAEQVTSSSTNLFLFTLVFFLLALDKKCRRRVDRDVKCKAVALKLTIVALNLSRLVRVSLGEIPGAADLLACPTSKKYAADLN